MTINPTRFITHPLYCWRPVNADCAVRALDVLARSSGAAQRVRSLRNGPRCAQLVVFDTDRGNRRATFPLCATNSIPAGSRVPTSAGVTGERRPEMDTNERIDEKRRRRTITARARTFYPRGAESDCR